MSSNLRVNNIFPSVGTNVAIGTAGGSITLTGTVSGSSNINVGTGASISSPATNVLALGTNNSERVRIDSSGQFGINVTSPTAKFQINSQDGLLADVSSVYSYIRLGSAATGEGTSEFGYDRSTGANIFKQGTTGSALNERLRIDSSGNLGIGTANPGAKLHVSGGNIKVDSGYGIDFSSTTNSLGTTSSELLSDYEEGTWTPIASASAGTITSYTSSGRYIKIGRIVTLHFAINISNQGTASGAYLLWSGAPYVAANTFTAVGTCREQNVNGFLSTAQINGNGSSGSILRYDNNGVIVNGNFSCTIVYEAA